MIIYADFTSAYCYLASLRLDRLMAAGHDPVDWRAVEHRPGLPRPGLHLKGTARLIRGRELAATRCLLTHGEEFEARNPRCLPNTRSVNAAYALARAHGFGDQARRAIFDGYWVQGLHIGDPDVVRRLVPTMLYQPSQSLRTPTEDWQREWLTLATGIDLTIVSAHHIECGQAALEQLAGNPLRVA